ncbi:BA14K family protein [Falsochrobactrum ovis]
MEWCLSKYRSYDIRTNTFQPFNGPRRFCNSPYR